jgi:ATP-dependent helicase HrpB
MIPFAPPEILVSDLSSLALELAVWGVKDPSVLSWLDPPPAPSWDSAIRLLNDLGAVDKSASVTSEGRKMARFPLHPRLARLLLRAEELGCPRLGADLAALLSERDVLRRDVSRGRMVRDSEPDIAARTDILMEWRKGRGAPDNSDPWALRAVDRISGQLSGLMRAAPKAFGQERPDPDTISRLLLSAFPDRVAQLREDGDGHFVLSQGRGARLPATAGLSRSPYIVAVNVDAGEKAEGIVHLASPISEELMRGELRGRIETLRSVGWDRRTEKIVATVQERIGAVVLSSKPFSPSDEEALPIVCEAVSSNPGMLIFSDEARQFQGRVALMRRTFPDEDWPDLSDENLFLSLKEWLSPWLRGRRSSQDLKNMDVLPALKARLSWEKARLLEDRAPKTIGVPSGHHVAIDYAAGDVPVLAVKLQEMFGLADTPAIAGGRVKLLLHLLSPARRPVQITKDLRGFWDGGYQQVKKELKGRYPKHPWPDDPWNAVPTRRAGKGSKEVK